MTTSVLKDKRILVIGGSSGIGRAIAEAALSEGANVMIASSNADKVASAAKQLGASVRSAQLDVSDEAAVARFFETANVFDHIAFTAGDWTHAAPGPLANLDLSKAASGLKIRYWGAIAVAKHGATRLPPGGSYTITNGMLAHQPMKGMPLVTAGAAAVEFLAKGLAVDLAPIRVNCVCPGLIRTEMWDAFPEGYRDRLEKMSERQLVSRPGTPAEAAESYLYLMRNTYATGQVIYIEGGSSLAR
jgi:NAD(P)-dependent dehydrogenase (short-subunit alcohol dehydrogenase family)